MASFLSTLQSGRLLLMDGAMGTELHRLSPTTPLADLGLLNLSQPDLVRSVHRAYYDAGASVVLTNTFQTHDLWQAGLQLARDAVPCFVLADVGPVEPCSRAIARRILDECRSADGVLLETWSSLNALQQFADARLDADVPLLVSFTFQSGRTFAGALPEECARAAMDAGAVALGANCGKEVGMLDMVELVQRYRAVSDLPIFVRPNAGTPIRTAEGWKYPHSPAAMAALLPSLLDAGVTMVGGCCGTTPEHIRAFRQVMLPKEPRTQ